MSQAYLGEIRMFGGNFPPAGWAFCDGAAMSISQYTSLYGLIGTTYGGDGQTYFNLPNLQGRLPISAGQNPLTGTTYVLGQNGGVESATLAVSQLPSHTHAALAQLSDGTQLGPANAVWAGTSLPQYSQNNANSTMDARNVQATGGSQPHTNMMPYLAVSFIINIASPNYPAP